MFKLTVIGYIPNDNSPSNILDDIYGKGNYEIVEISRGDKLTTECTHTVIINEGLRDDAEDEWFKMVNEKGFDDWVLKYTSKINE